MIDLSQVPQGRPKAAWAAAFALVAAFAASVILGPQLAIWPSGPALLCLAAGCLLAIPLAPRVPLAVAVTGFALVGWLAARCATSPVAEFAAADGVLLASCVAVFWIARGLLDRPGGLEILFTGLGLLVLANWVPMYFQARDPGYELWLPRGTDTFPSGFFGYYGDCAAFLTGMALLAGGLVWDSRRAPWFRIFMGLVALAAAAGVAFTKARGGILGLGAGALPLLVLAPWLCLRRGSQGRGILALALPVAVIGAILWIGDGLADAQRVRGAAGSGPLLDNAARLFWLKLAGSCIALHPWSGGGSRSFSWENLRFWDREWSKFSDAEPEFVHNEWLQTASDYGIVGLLLLVVFLGAMVVTGIVGRWSGDAAKPATAVFLAGLAALTGLLVHATFHFVFHVPPAALLLGLALAMLIEPARGKAADPRRWSVLRAAPVPLACATVLFFFGGKAVAVFRELAPVTYRFGGERAVMPEWLDRLEAATRIWSLPSLHLRSGRISQQLAIDATGPDQRRLAENAEAEFRKALELDPFLAEASVNLANVLSGLGRDAEAEREFERAIRLQGGLETGFRSYYSASTHHLIKAERLRAAGKLDDALLSLIQARDLFDRAASPEAWEYGRAGQDYRLALAVNLGPWLEGLGRHREAEEEYVRALQIPDAHAIPFLSARNLAAWGDAIWLERKPESALRKFHAARDRVTEARGMVPEGFAVTDLVELSKRVASKIEFLEGAGIRPGDDGGQAGEGGE